MAPLVNFQSEIKGEGQSFDYRKQYKTTGTTKAFTLVKIVPQVGNESHRS